MRNYQSRNWGLITREYIPCQSPVRELPVVRELIYCACTHMQKPDDGCMDVQMDNTYYRGPKKRACMAIRPGGSKKKNDAKAKP